MSAGVMVDSSVAGSKVSCLFSLGEITSNCIPCILYNMCILHILHNLCIFWIPDWVKATRSMVFTAVIHDRIGCAGILRVKVSLKRILGHCGMVAWSSVINNFAYCLLHKCDVSGNFTCIRKRMCSRSYWELKSVWRKVEACSSWHVQ